MKPLFLLPGQALVDAVRMIEDSHRRIAVVADSDRKLLGTLTDGDVRRCLLSGGNLQTPVDQAMNPEPLSALEGSTDSFMLSIMKQRNVLALPLVDSEQRLLRLVHLRDLTRAPGPESDATGFDFAVIMAGGEGARLRPRTDAIPKPMIPIAGVPILERQIGRLVQAKLPRVYLSVNYLSHVIEEHFGDGDGFGLEVRYLRETQKLGTAGALSLLPETPKRPIIVMNGDILTSSDFRNFSAFHIEHQAVVTVAAISYRVDIPYGVIGTEGSFAQELTEKPTQNFLCNAGLYALSREALEMIPHNKQYNMTDLINDCLEGDRPVSVFPIHEYWNDIGSPDDLERAQSFYEQDGLTE